MKYLLSAMLVVFVGTVVSSFAAENGPSGVIEIVPKESFDTSKYRDFVFYQNGARLEAGQEPARGKPYCLIGLSSGMLPKSPITVFKQDVRVWKKLGGISTLYVDAPGAKYFRCHSAESREPEASDFRTHFGAAFEFTGHKGSLAGIEPRIEDRAPAKVVEKLSSHNAESSHAARQKSGVR